MRQCTGFIGTDNAGRTQGLHRRQLSDNRVAFDHPIPVEGTNDYRRDREGNVIVTRLNEAMCQEIAKEGKGIYVRVDNSNSAQRAINQEVNKMAKSDVESKVYTEFNEQFQAIAWVILLLLLAEILILDRKNPLFKNIHLFSNKK